ncbi:MAG: sigma factor-like helix-turn-helix DNA-binding protein [Patescibacteria group bacterium]
MASATKLINSMLQVLIPRQRDVIIARFGIGGKGEEETLASIGKKMNITRERVRQIEKSALDTLRTHISENPLCVELLNSGKKRLKNAGGVLRIELMHKHNDSVLDGLGDGQFHLILESSGAFNFYPADDDYWPFYYLSANDLKRASSFTESWINFLKGCKQEALSGNYAQLLKSFVKTKNVNKDHAENFLGITKKIHANPYGDMGMRDWPEIRPKTARDRAYLALKKKNKPLHFTEIAEEINKYELSPQLALASTVHNELIKDSRFVLVGRGMYALKESGYEPGIAREIIQKVLKKHGPLSLKDVINTVGEQRFFKPNTIIINLQNRNFFERLPDGTYRVRGS